MPTAVPTELGPTEPGPAGVGPTEPDPELGPAGGGPAGPDRVPDDALTPALSDPHAGGSLPSALPVSLEVGGPRREAVRRTVEGALGWQLVDDDTAALVPPAVRLVDVAAVAVSATPTVLLVTDTDDPCAAAEATARLDPAAVVPWPTSDARLAAAVARAGAAPRRDRSMTATIRLGGSAGGVGTTTVALALAGLAAWRGATVLVASGDRVVLPRGAPTIEPAALAAPDLFVRAAAVRGVVGARAVRLTDPPLDVQLADPTVGAAVLDLGVADEVDVLVVRPDAAGIAALGRTSAAAVVVTGSGPVPGRDLAAAIGRRRRVDLPASHRVARAALVGRVPAALPGRYVAALAPLLPAPRRTRDGPTAG